jgi:indole-3-glycerol phosphate synthase/phosphoribosylanthranilate isomerase
VIETIISRKKIDVAEREKQLPLEQIARGLKPSDRSLKEALRKKTTGYILECKKASPSKGMIRPDFDVVRIAQEYGPFADAISVICDEPFFQGELGFVTKVRDVVSCPVLCKDFFVLPYQVYEARHYGADAILLMMSVVSDDVYLQCAKVAAELSMDVLTEVHDEDELVRALKLGAQMIGVNNRDFKTLKVSLDVSRRLIRSVPKDKIIVVESGIYTHQETLEFRDRVNGFLVGTSLMEKTRIDLAARELIFGRVKVCGLTSIEDAQAAYQSGAIFGGLIFAAQSPRQVSEERALTIAASTPLKWVGVFVNESVERVASLCNRLKLYAVQLHGDEDRAYVTALRAALPEGALIWKAVRVQSEIPSLSEYGADKILLDTFKSGQRGGTGEVFDWSLLKARGDRQDYILSGGVSPDNVGDADLLGAWALDVNSKVEEAPGKKSHDLLKELFLNLRGHQ